MHGTMLPIQTASHTEAGRRRMNQDAVAVVELPGGRTLLAVADGMGGHSAGEEASRRALEVLQRELWHGADLASAVLAANSEVFAAASANPEWEGMGTTLVAVLVANGSYVVANVGDSRAYRVDATGVNLITTDHSIMAEAAAKGSAAIAEVEKSRWRNALTRALGTTPEVEVDIFGPFQFDAPHTLLLCSDGLYRTLSDSDIANCLSDVTDLDAAIRQLTRLSFERGSKDNISAVAIAFGARSSVAAPIPALLNEVAIRNVALGARDSFIAARRQSGSRSRHHSSKRRRWLRRLKERWRKYDAFVALAIIVSLFWYLLVRLG